MINQSNVHQKRVNSFQRGGDVLSGSRVDNDVTIGAGELTRHSKSHNVKGSARLGQLMPVDLMNVLPNENFRVRMSNTVQFEPLNKPILDSLITKLHTYNVTYKQIFGDAWEMFFKGGKTGSYRKELPFFDCTSFSSGVLQRTATTSGSSQATIYAIAFLSWAFAHHMKVMDVIRWASTHLNDDPSSAVVFDTEKLKIILETTFGKGSLLDMFNLGVGAFDWKYVAGSETRYGNYSLPNCIPVDRLLAYQLICSKYYRIDDYTFDFFEDAEDLGSEIYGMDYEVDVTNKIGLIGQAIATDDGMHIGAILRNLDKISTGDGNSHDFVDKGAICHFTIKNGLSVYGAVGPTLDTSASQNFYYTKSAIILAWLLSMRPVPVEKDYLTMILPRTQRGIVESIGNMPLQVGTNEPYGLSLLSPDGQRFIKPNSSSSFIVIGDRDTTGSAERQMHVNLDMDVLRYVNSATKLAEKMNLVGSDYGDQLLAEFGIKPSYANMDKPIYLGGLKTTPRIDKVTSTADTSALSSNNGKELGVYSGDATQFADGSYSFVAGDFGMIITIMSTVPELSYSRFVDRNAFNFFDRFNWFHKEFEDLTEQHLYAQEFKGNDTMKLANMCAGRVAPTENDVVGYVPREQHLRSIPNTVHGELIPSLGGEDDIVWTMARDFNGINEFTKNDILYNSVDAPENSRIFTFANIVEYPPMKFECGFGVDVLSPVGRITLPITI